MTPGHGRGASDRVQECSAADARTRLRQAQLYLDVARLVLDEEADEAATVDTGNAVLAGIAAADAITCAAVRQRFRGRDHREAANHLERVTGDRKLAGLLRDLVDLKDSGHYGLTDVAMSRAKSAARKAGQLVDAAGERIR